MAPGTQPGWRVLLAVVPFIVYMIAVAVFALPDGQRLSWTGVMLGLSGMTLSILSLMGRRPAVRPAMWRILRTALWLVPLALIVVLVVLPLLNDTTATARRIALYLGAGLLLQVAGTLVVLRWMREKRRRGPTESAGRG